MRRSTSSIAELSESAGLARLLQLASPALPIGAYTYSQGLEWAVEAGWVSDASSAQCWIGDALRLSFARFEAPLLAAQIGAWSRHETTEVMRLNDEFLASRESAELRAETVQMGYSLARLLADLGVLDAALRAELEVQSELALPTLWSLAAARWGVPQGAAVTAYLWSWLENQVMAAVKTVPLGQTAGQRMLLQLAAGLDALAQQALLLDESEWSNFAPRLALASSRHESQYSRLFRS